MFSGWPDGFDRIPDSDWVQLPVEELALKYDTVEDHGWYRNLDRTVAGIADWAQPGHLLVDYSGGTGILASRLLEEAAQRRFGILIVDSSPKFLRLALEKLRRHERVAFRLIRYLKPEKRLQLMQEVLGSTLLERKLDGLVSTNAIHLYYGLENTLRSWAEVLRPGGRVFIQSGNIGLPYLPQVRGSSTRRWMPFTRPPCRSSPRTNATAPTAPAPAPRAWAATMISGASSSCR